MENSNIEDIKKEFYNQFLEEVESARKNIIKINDKIKEEKAKIEEIDISSFDINKTKDKQYELYRKISELQTQIENHGDSPLAKSWKNELAVKKDELEKTKSLIEKLEMPRSKRIEILEKQKQDEVRVPKIKVNNLIEAAQTEINKSETDYKNLEQKLREQTKIYMSFELPEGKTSRKDAFPEQYEFCEKIAEKLKQEKTILMESYKKLDSLKEIKERIDSFLLEDKTKNVESAKEPLEEKPLEEEMLEEELLEGEPLKEEPIEGKPINGNIVKFNSLKITKNDINYLDENGEIIAEKPHEDMTKEDFLNILKENHLLAFKGLDIEDVDKNIVNALKKDSQNLSNYLCLIEDNIAINQEEIAKSLVNIEYDLTDLRKDKEMTIDEKLKLYRQAKETRELFDYYNSKNGKIKISLLDKAYFEIRNVLSKIKNVNKQNKTLAIEEASESNIRKDIPKIHVDHSVAQTNAQNQEKTEIDKENLK